MAPKFGTSGLRGLVSDLTDALCASYTRAFLSGTPHDGLLLVGHDLRPSSRQHLRAVAAGARALGIDVLDCGAVPTPALALEGQRRHAPAIMVTGSHIPADRNGLKFYTRTGEITKADEEAITAALRPWDGAMDLSDPEESEIAGARYIRRFTGHFASDALAGLTLGIYEHSAVGSDLLGVVLRDLGADTVALARSETFIPVDTEAVDPETRAMLRDWATGHRLDSIVSLDGDSDRPLVTDETGHVVPGDILGAITARHLGADTVVTPVSSNSMIEAMDAFDVRRTRIGSPFVIAGIEQALADNPNARAVGYEANGGFLTGFTAQGPTGPLTPLMTRDALLPIICTLAACVAERRALSGLLSTLPARRTAADRVQGLPTDTSRALVARLTADEQARADLFADMGPRAGIDTTDGLRLTFTSGEVVHLRPSGNAPELRCYAEAETESRAAAIVAATLSRIARIPRQ